MSLLSALLIETEERMHIPGGEAGNKSVSDTSPECYCWIIEWLCLFLLLFIHISIMTLYKMMALRKKKKHNFFDQYIA